MFEKPVMNWKPIALALAVAIPFWLGLAYAAFADEIAAPPEVSNGLPRPEREGPCVSHALFWFPPLEQSVCGFTTLEEMFKAACVDAGGTWDFVPGHDAKCTGELAHAKPTN